MHDLDQDQIDRLAQWHRFFRGGGLNGDGLQVHRSAGLSPGFIRLDLDDGVVDCSEDTYDAVRRAVHFLDMQAEATPAGVEGDVHG